MNTGWCQWQVGSGTFRPVSTTVPAIPPGAYLCRSDDSGPYLSSLPILSDNLITLPESANIQVLEVIGKFWDSREKYRKHGLVFKRGVLLWGPPGSGKTVTCHLLTRDLIARGGIVLYSNYPAVTMQVIDAVRTIEPKRPLIVVFEDIDETIREHGDRELLSILDGERQTDNIVSIATTNYIGRLSARFANRPSRFDDRIFIGMPSEATRLAYLRRVTYDLSEATASAWARDTEGFSIAHLRELIVAVRCLEQDYDDVMARLRSMNDQPADVDGFTGKAPKPSGNTMWKEEDVAAGNARLRDRFAEIAQGASE